MNIEKQFWKLIYFYVKYLNYQIAHTNENETEVWLSNKNKKKLVIIKTGVSSTQELRFDKSRVLEHQEEIAAYTGFKPQDVTFNYLTEKMFTYENLSEIHPIRMRFNVIRNQKELLKVLPNPLLTKLYTRDNEKTSLYYKRRLHSNNPLEKYMMKFAPVTYSLIAINIIVWLFMFLIVNAFSSRSLLDWGGLVHFNVVHGEIYRLITSMFIHFNFEHILMNMLSLFIFGKLVEAIVGHWKMLGIYFISGIFGNIVSLAIDTNSISVGASGAIFGLIGSLFAIMYISKTYTSKMLMQLIFVLAILTVVSLFIANVNIYAHIGGFVGGALATFISYYFNRDRKMFWILLGTAILLLLILLIRTFTIKEDNIYDKLISDEMSNGNYNKAEALIKHTMDKGYADDETYYLSGLLKATKDSKSEGISTWERGLKHYPESGILNYELAIANRSLGDDKSALRHIKKAVKSEPDNEKYKYLKKELEKQNESKNR
ncbi:rhomboid family intramembrane serine protease [Staphylococcus sp. IVB6181]|uniref:rhomboid family intramembrane serine protease n=1 Tax=Staphylococcus sp. IVB6181 TaxID=2929481 RepID=UPI0021D3B654|nr:rhomboid family intramembrane serine protease [Staphylococcus sp. IVB6181]UXV33831.1 rhomboid family intramembrane serine protease [Staphylococcus sp. IVB6181]